MKKDEVIKHLCAGGVIYHEGKVAMLVDRYGRLVLPKGHIDRSEDAEKAAEREIAEETGYTNLKLIKPLNVEEFNYKIKGAARHKKVVHNFLFELVGTKKPSPRLESGEIYETRWLELDQAIKKAHFQNSKRLLEDVKRYYDKRDEDKSY